MWRFRSVAGRTALSEFKPSDATRLFVYPGLSVMFRVCAACLVCQWWFSPVDRYGFEKPLVLYQLHPLVCYHWSDYPQRRFILCFHLSNRVREWLSVRLMSSRSLLCLLFSLLLLRVWGNVLPTVPCACVTYVSRSTFANAKWFLRLVLLWNILDNDPFAIWVGRTRTVHIDIV